jgi:hypothetical protein
MGRELAYALFLVGREHELGAGLSELFAMLET